MDIGTHMLIGYLIAWTAAFTVTGYHDYLFLLAVVMTMIPDFDIFLFLFPKSFRRRFRGFTHRGITHTIIFLMGCAIVVAYLFHLAYGTDLVIGIGLAFIAGLSHAFIDGLTSFSFPALAPFSWKERSLDLDGAVTWYMVPFSVLSLVAMWGMRAYGVPFGTYRLFVALVFGVILAHYLARLSVKLYVERVLYRGQGARVNPTFTLLSFYVVLRRSVRGTGLAEYIRMKLPRSRMRPEPKYFELDRLGGESIDRPADVYEAVVASSAALGPGGPRGPSAMAAAPLPSNKTAGEWKLFWFDWNDWNPVRGTPGTVVTVSPSGGVVTESGSHRITW